MPPVTEGFVAFGRLTPQERGRERNAVKVPEPQILEETVQVVRQRTSEQMADVPSCFSRRCRLIARERCNSDRQKFVDPRQFREEIVGMDRLAPHERVQQQTAKENLPYL